MVGVNILDLCMAFDAINHDLLVTNYKYVVDVRQYYFGSKALSDGRQCVNLTFAKHFI